MDYITGLGKTLYWPIVGSAGYIYNTAGHKIEMQPLWRLAAEAGPYVKLAALSGAAAVGLGAYGSHRKYLDVDDVGLKQVFETANRYHFIHTLAMLGLPFCRRPYLGAVFFVSGMVLFSGTCYYYAFTGDGTYRRYTPIGGVCLIVAWLSMCL
ncbi:transmembrane protein 256 homolog isoform X2 [Lasioglossum baleicum]|uniref:transmembrane protein 256 homolog isoform X2 n=1 Tax=Lasioglossum baleicum TaxID=434251 RepID=UPI003FCCB697